MARRGARKQNLVRGPAQTAAQRPAPNPTRDQPTSCSCCCSAKTQDALVASALPLRRGAVPTKPGRAEDGAEDGAEGGQQRRGRRGQRRGGSPEAEPDAWSGTDNSARPGADPDAESSQRDLSLPPLADCCVRSPSIRSIPMWPPPCHLPTQSQVTRVPRCNGTRNTESAPAHIAMGLETVSLFPQRRGDVGGRR